jgi:lysozyme
MGPRHRVSRAAIELIKRFEGYRRNAAQLPDGRWTIGYGHTLTARQGAEVSESDAEALLIYDLIAVAHEVNEQVFAPITQNQFDALASFAFNVGLDAFCNSQVLKRLNEGQTVQAGCAMELWRKAEFMGERIVIDALVRRRAAEKALFLTPPNDAWVPAPSPVLRPLVDAKAAELIPAEVPAEVVTSLEGDRVEVSREGAPPEPMAAEEREPGEGVRAAAESVARRLSSIFPVSEREPEPEPTPVTPLLDEDARPQAGFAPPITVEPETTPEPESETAPEAEGFEVPLPSPEAVEVSAQPSEEYQFLSARPQPVEPARENSVVLDIVLGVLGLMFFSFGAVWGMTARPDPAASFISPLMVAWLACPAGVAFFSVAVYRLLRRIERAAERE